MTERRPYFVWTVMATALAAIAAIGPIIARSAAQSPAIRTTGREWPLAGGDLGDSRFSPLSQIDTQNVKTLDGAWVSKKFTDGGSSRVTPVVKDDRMFVSAGFQVYALNPATGENIWTYDNGAGKPPGPSDLMHIYNVPQGLPNNQGVAIGEGLVFVGLTNGDVIALDEMTGKLAWKQHVGDDPPRKTQTVTGAPIYANGAVFCGLATVERSVGRAVALDAKTGHELWRFAIVPGPGEAGHETWMQKGDDWKLGGGNIWLPATADPDLGLVYYGTGNATPVRGGDLRPGNNLYTSSVVALDMKTGKLRWYYQLIHHDLWEGDVATPIILYETQMGGRKRKGVAAMRPDGYLFLLDRETGKPLIPTEERPVPQSASNRTSSTQPYPIGADSIVPGLDCPSLKEKIPAGFVLSCSTFTPPSLDAPNVLAPGGNVRVEPMSYSFQTGYFYAQARGQSLGWVRRPVDSYYYGSGGGHVPGLNRLGTPSSIIGAIDSRTGKLAWVKQVPPGGGGFGSGGFLSTGGGLLFHRLSDGSLEAFDAKTGDVLWQFQPGLGGSDASPMSYEISGQQYIAIVNGSAVWAFKLGGTLKPQPLTAPPPPQAGGRGQGGGAADADGFAGPIDDTDVVELVSVVQEDPYASGKRYVLDEYSFSPYRARVKVGMPVTFANTGDKVHTVAALDGSWTTGPLLQNETRSITFSKPGSYAYSCKNHPWSYGEIVVVDDSGQAGAGSDRGGAGTRQGAGGGLQAQAARGRAAYESSCATCHAPDLSGNSQMAAPALTGNDFLAQWRGRTAGDLFDKTRTTMPTRNPASLSPQAYLDIVAYMLQVNGLLSGNAELTAETAKALNLNGR